MIFIFQLSSRRVKEDRLLTISFFFFVDRLLSGIVTRFKLNYYTIVKHFLFNNYSNEKKTKQEKK